jgi:large subunit ribosomal protein L28
MARYCELTGKGPIKGNRIWRSGKAKKQGGIGTHVTAITKRRFLPNLQRVKALINGEVRYIRVAARASSLKRRSDGGKSRRRKLDGGFACRAKAYRKQEFSARGRHLEVLRPFALLQYSLVGASGWLDPSSLLKKS